jgi:SAM-dependent methyltransferase
MLEHMRNPAKVGIPTIMTGLVELCECLKANLPADKVLVMYELGSFAGEAAAVFARYFGLVHAVDPWEDACGAPEGLQSVIESFDERCRLAGNIVAHQMTASEAALTVPDGSVDFVYVDSGPHTYEGNLREIREWWPKVRPGGFMGGHDWEITALRAVDVFPGVERSVRAFFPADVLSSLKIFPDTSWLVRKL